MEHPVEIEKYDWSLQELAEDLGNLRYDALRDFLNHLARKLEEDSHADAARGRMQLAGKLVNAASTLDEASSWVHEAWVICEPRMTQT